MSRNTIEMNRHMARFEGQDEVWLFGYGSLLWKADFDYIERRPAHIHGWARRFWQGSHDHRGTPEAPGRVATLIPQAGAVCAGMAYLITPAVFDYLDVREKNGYLRHEVPLEFRDGETTTGLIYIASDTNAAWLGSASEAEIARHIATARGPSGLNREYLIRVAQVLRDLGEEDAHVFAIERELKALESETDHQA